MRDTLTAVAFLLVAGIAGWLWVAVHRDTRRGGLNRPAGAERAPLYRLALCEGCRCVPAVDLDGRCPAPRAPEAVLACRADQYRAAGVIGRLLLVDGGSGTTLASRRVWP